jgi:hypothetical protein
VKVPFTWKVTGWFVIGWSAEFPWARCVRSGISVRTLSLTATSQVSCTSSRATAGTSVLTSDTVATRRQGGRRLRRVPVSRLAMGS